VSVGAITIRQDSTAWNPSKCKNIWGKQEQMPDDCSFQVVLYRPGNLSQNCWYLYTS
jgi:hypothetical protein